jgi:hypothetical protein
VEQDVSLIQEDSYFNDFSVSDNMVHMECYLTINNSTKKEVSVKINASSDEDVAGGLLKSANMNGFDETLSSDTFVLSSGENSITVIFIGKFGGKKQKQNRLLPENIVFEIVK